MIRTLPRPVALVFYAAVFSVSAQTNAPVTCPAPPTNRLSMLKLSEQLCGQYIAGRHLICGMILRNSPDGILVESGYTNLVRVPLTRSWLVLGITSSA